MSDSDLSLIPTDEIRSALCETVENYLKTKKYKISVKSASQAGESNFVGVVYRVSFCKEDGDPNDNKSSKLILKVAPQNEARRTQFKSRSLFLREMYMYNVVIYTIFIFYYFKSQFKLIRLKGAAVFAGLRAIKRCNR